MYSSRLLGISHHRRRGIAGMSDQRIRSKITRISVLVKFNLPMPVAERVHDLGSGEVMKPKSRCGRRRG